MLIHLFNSNAEPTRLDKTDYIKNQVTLSGTLRDECNILNPQIIIESNITLVRFNYAYIPDFFRYYYVTDIDVVRTDGNKSLYRLSLSVDVLMSYRDEIRKLKVILRRQENKTTPNIVDTKLPCDVNYSINYLYPTGGDDLGVNKSTSYCYIVTVATYPGYNDTTRLPTANHPTNVTGNQVYSFSYVMDWKRIALFADKLMGSDLNLNDFFNSLFNDVNQCLINVLMLPINIGTNSPKFGLKMKTGSNVMYIGKGNITLEGELPLIYDSDYIELYLGAITISPVYNNFLDYAPYTELTIFLPFVGYRTLDINECLGKTLHIYYFIDFITGKASCRIYFNKVYDNQVPVYVYDCTVGDSISLSASNVAERIRNLTILGIKTAASIATMGSTAGFINELPTSTAKQIVAKNRAQKNLMSEKTNLITDTTVNTVQALRNNVEKGDLRSSLSLLDTRNINLDKFQWNVFVRLKRPIPLQKTDYNRLVGRPCIEDGVLNNFEGYTEVASCHMENFPNATQDEVEEIENIIKNGFIMSGGTLTWKITIDVENGVLGEHDNTIQTGSTAVIKVIMNEYYTLTNEDITVTNATLIGVARVSNTQTFQITIANPTDDVTVQVIGQEVPQTIKAGYYQFIDTLPTRTTPFNQEITFKDTDQQEYNYMEWKPTGLLTGLFYAGIQVYDKSSNMWTDSKFKVIQVLNDTTTTLDFFTWFTDNTSPYTPPTEYTDCITFTGENSEFTLSIGANGAKEWDGTVWYSTDHNTWTVWGGSAISSVDKKLYLRGKNNTKFYTSSGACLSLSAKAGCSGNLNTLLEYNNPPTTLEVWCYAYMFYGCTNLTTAPELPATTLVDYCYYYMFQGCTNLTAAPELPATTLANYCYYNMFNGCTKLTKAPALPATTLANYCYFYMFQGCTNLTAAPELPATTLANSCYYYMFQGCTNLTAAPELPATTLANYCYSNMFRGCTNLTTAPELPATTLANYCYSSMFNGCTSLTVAPELPATTLAEGCYVYMFYDCTSLKVNNTSGEKIFTCPSNLPTGTVDNMFVNTGGTFKGTPTAGNTYYWYE